MNYLSLADCCCSFGGSPSEELSIDEQICLVKADGTVLDSYFYNSSLKDGETYTAKKFWALRKSVKVLKRFDTKEEAQAELDRIVKELSENNTVVSL